MIRLLLVVSLRAVSCFAQLPFQPDAYNTVLGPTGAAQLFGNSAEAQQFFDRLATPPTAAREALYSALIDGLVADGVWSHIDCLYVFAATDQGIALTNLRQLSYQGSLNDNAGAGAPTFTADRGFTGASNVVNVVTNFNPATATTPNFAQNNAMIAAWSLTTTQITKQLIEQASVAGKIELWPKYSDGKLYNTVNGTEYGPTAGTDSSGFFLAQRTASNAEAVYRNDTLMGSGSSTSAAPTSSKICFSLGAFQTAAGVIGSSLTSGQRTALYSRLLTYLQAVGAQ